MNKGFGLNGILIAILIILAIGIAGVYVVKNNNSNNQECDYNNPDKKYVGISNSECSTIRFRCKIGTKSFSNECGCGCEVDNNTPTSP